MIIELDGRRVRRPGWEIWKKRGASEYFLILCAWGSNFPVVKENPRWQGYWWVPTAHGGDLACTAPAAKECRIVSWNATPVEIREKMRECILRIEKVGLPHERDESIFDL